VIATLLITSITDEHSPKPITANAVTGSAIAPAGFAARSQKRRAHRF
jgi:hypothetical protein